MKAAIFPSSSVLVRRDPAGAGLQRQAVDLPLAGGPCCPTCGSRGRQWGRRLRRLYRYGVDGVWDGLLHCSASCRAVRLSRMVEL